MKNINYFLIISLRRCGSTFLQAELDSYKNIFCQYEHVRRSHDKLRKAHVPIPEKSFSFIESIEKLSGNEKYKGSKLTFNDYQIINIDEILGFVRRDGIKVIHITRPLCEQLVSVKVAAYTGIWNVVESREDKIPDDMRGERGHGCGNVDAKLWPMMFHIDREEAEDFCMKVNDIDQKITQLKGTNPYLHVKAEYLSDSIREILNFLGAYYNALQKVKRQNMGRNIKSTHKDLVSNWHELEEIFRRWEKLRDYRL